MLDRYRSETREGPTDQGPDLQGLDVAFPFHPTAVGSRRMAAAVARLVVEPER
jgi:hypothetical protein